MKKKKWIYKTTLLNSNPYEIVPIIKKGIITQCLCLHKYVYLVKEDANKLYMNEKGDNISYVCLKCGKEKFNILWEYEGWGYK